MTDEERIVEGLKRIENKNRKRGHATCWHAENEFQGPMEVFATRAWAEEINRQGLLDQYPYDPEEHRAIPGLLG